MKIKSFLLSAAIALCLPISARIVTYDVGPFDKISQLGNINVVYSNNPDSVGMAFYESDKNCSDAIEITNSKGRLNIKELPGHQFSKLPTLHVYSEYVSSIKNEGTSTITAFLSSVTPGFSVNLIGNGKIICNDINSTQVKASLTTGNGTIVLRGRCTDANFKLTGTGIIQADGLAARNVKCMALGTGTIGCNASDNLDVRAVGATKIFYTGNPKIRKTGVATLKQLPSKTISETEFLEMNTVIPEEDGEEEVTEVYEETVITQPRE